MKIRLWLIKKLKATPDEIVNKEVTKIITHFLDKKINRQRLESILSGFK